MSDERPAGSERGDARKRMEDFRTTIGRKEQRKLEARRARRRNLWFGLGMFGLVGWSVAIPTLLGVAIGLWIDRTWPGPFLWTLTGLVAGVMLGCLNAWYWVNREGKT